MVKPSTTNKGEPIFACKRRPIPLETLKTKGVTMTEALEALGLALSSPALNPGHATTIRKFSGSYTLTIPKGSFFPGGPLESQLDLCEAMEAAAEKSKPPTKRPPQFPLKVEFDLDSLDPATHAFLWPGDRELRVPSRLKEPDSKLLTTASTARSAHANRVSALALMGALRDLSVNIANKATTMHREDLQ